MFEYKDECDQDSPFFRCDVQVQLPRADSARLKRGITRNTARTTTTPIAALIADARLPTATTATALNTGGVWTRVTWSATEATVRESCLCCTCWWYSLCTFQYRPHCENRTTVTVKCIRTCIFLFLFDVEMQGRVGSRLTFFFDFIDSGTRAHRRRGQAPPAHADGLRNTIVHMTPPGVYWACKVPEPGLYVTCVLYMLVVLVVYLPVPTTLWKDLLTLTVACIRTCIFVLLFYV